MSPPELRHLVSDWFRQWRVPLRKFLHSRKAIRNAELDDVAQEVFLRLLRYDRAKLVEHPQAYLFRMASNVAAEWTLRPSYQRAHEAHWLDTLPTGDEPAHAAEQQDAKAAIASAINALPDHQREIVRLHFEEGPGYGEIAERLGTSHRSVKGHLARSYAKLRRTLNADLIGALTHGRE
jgi:RNA polymerase sigma-70 factor (ECF subfamily)